MAGLSTGSSARVPSRPLRASSQGVGGSDRGGGGSAVSINEVLASPPRLPQAVADKMIVEAATEAARALALDDRTWHQVKEWLGLVGRLAAALVRYKLWREISLSLHTLPCICALSRGTRMFKEKGETSDEA